jgi:hypothetical protein
MANLLIGAAAQQRLPPRLPWSADISTCIADRSEARRTAQQGRVARRIEAMADCPDFRAMASFSADGYTTAAKPTYVCLRGWPCPQRPRAQCPSSALGRRSRTASRCLRTRR